MKTVCDIKLFYHRNKNFFVTPYSINYKPFRFKSLVCRLTSYMMLIT